MVCLDRLSSLSPKQSFLSVSTISCIPSLTERHYPGGRSQQTWDSASVPSFSPNPVSLQNPASLLSSPHPAPPLSPTPVNCINHPEALPLTAFSLFPSILTHLSVCSQTCIWWGYLQWLPTACRMKTNALASRPCPLTPHLSPLPHALFST